MSEVNMVLMQSEEAAFVSSLDTALKANGARFLAVYTSLPASPTTLSKPAREGALERRRQLLARDGEVHDALFVLQADLVRAFLVVFFTVVALLSGLCCLMSVRGGDARLLCTAWPLVALLQNVVKV